MMILLGILSVIVIIAMAVLFLANRKLNQEYEVGLIAEKQLVEKELQSYRSQFLALFDFSTTGIALLSLEGRFIKVNKQMCELLGYSQADILAMNYFYFVQSTDVNDLQIHIQQIINNDISLYRNEQKWIRKNSEVIWITATLSLIRNDKNNPVCFILQAQDINTQKLAEERLRHMAYHDPLTGLANRNKLEQIIVHILASARRHNQNFALLFLDLDRFKNINDTIGHEEGDLILQIVAERLRATVRATDVIARLGGDEFVLLLNDVKNSEAVAFIAQKILENILHVITLKGQEIYLTTSIGISMYPHDGQDMHTLMKNADLSLYRAKEQGRNNYQFYTKEMTIKALYKLALKNALAHALVKNELLLHYQPQMEIATRCITGVEALLRWKNKEYEMIAPSEIISLAEETGLIIPVSDWIIKTACMQLKAWHDLGLKTLIMSVNCSSRLFKHATFVDDLIATVNEHGLSTSVLEIEITESTIMEDPENTMRILLQLKDLGFRIVVDDFGTGYWSLRHLKQLIFDKIKIDKMYIQDIPTDESSTSIVRAIIAMAKRLNIISLAENVETREQYKFLQKEGCVEIQGYYLTQPLSPEGMTTYLQHPVPDAEVIDESIT